MANATPSRLGQDNQAGGVTELFLKLFAGEVMTVFNNKTVMKDKQRVRQIKNGKSVSFPVIGRNTASYHTPGAEILGNSISHSEQIITVDGLLVSPAFIASIDEAMNHYDVRAPYSKACGESLAQLYDKNVIRQLCLACRADHPITGENGGSQITSVDITSGLTDAANAQALYEAIKDAKQELVEKNVDGDPFCLLKPAEYFLLLSYPDLMDKDYSGTGNIANATLPRVAGCNLVMSNNAEFGSAITGTYGDKYNVDMTNTVGLVWMPEAVGTVQLMDLATEAEWDIRRQGTLVLAKMAVGHGVLDPTYAVELTAASGS